MFTSVASFVVYINNNFKIKTPSVKNMRQDLELCRLCGGSFKNTTMISLFDRSKKSTLQRIYQLTNIKLKNVSNLPSVMCLDCEKELERAYEFRNKCISAQTYFSSTEYKCNFVQSHRQKQHENSPEKESTLVKVELLSFEKKNEATYLECNAHSDINFKNPLHISIESECDFEALNEGKMTHSIYDVGQVELQTQSFEYTTHKIPSWNKKRAKLETNLEKDTYESVGVERTISQPVKANDNEEDTQGVDNPKSKDKEERNSKTRIYICDQCGNNFKYRSHFYSHIKRHTGVKPLQCEVCPNKFFTEGELKRHMRRHTGERPFPCQHCERRFTDYSTRIKHERTHTNERPFGCPQCGKAFTTSYVLKNHMLLHTGERSFKCTLCNKSFQRQTHLIVHTRSLIHKQNVERQQQKLI
ncbi:transcription factor Ouib-like [Zeugodacus cucurbitae]|uniref:transcription factor Ouib-like n=1 Tax=Zeugodacus cucurbitae TaxID=28588 RepID=UPI0023D94920|nr:transcription factor Ouib-like [Zeugodacus cucurbitae]